MPGPDLYGRLALASNSAGSVRQAGQILLANSCRHIFTGPESPKAGIESKLARMTITLRRIEPADYVALHQIFSGPKVVWGTLQMPFPSLEKWRKRLADPLEDRFGLVACIETELVGNIDIHTFPNHPRRRHVGQIGMAVRDDFQGQGVGTALMQAAVDMADQWLNLRRLELEVYADNAPALRLYEKFGFVIEGTAVQFAYRAGQYVDARLMARIKPG